VISKEETAEQIESAKAFLTAAGVYIKTLAEVGCAMQIPPVLRCVSRYLATVTILAFSGDMFLSLYCPQVPILPDHKAMQDTALP
jgi:hypothetical protein